MKKTIGTVRAIVFGSMLTAAVSCEGMQIENVAGLIYDGNEHDLTPLWKDYLSQHFDATHRAYLMHNGKDCSLLSHAACAGKPLLLATMGHLDTLTLEDLGNLFSALKPTAYASHDQYTALEQIVQAMIGTFGIDRVRQYRDARGRSFDQIVAEGTAGDFNAQRSIFPKLREWGLY
ncbi:MAG: hypothetical protein LBC04_02005 [Holosporaceae bacterium]|nr:hypothetical protein [Holosporaceae bacterium]